MSEKDFYDRIQSLKSENAKLLVQLDRKYNLQKYETHRDIEVCRQEPYRYLISRSVGQSDSPSDRRRTFTLLAILFFCIKIADEGYPDSGDDVDPVASLELPNANM